MASETDSTAQQPSPTYQPHVILIYSTAHLNHTQKIKFHYGLKGRYGKEGVVQKARAEPIGRAALLVSREHSQTVETFLKEWQCEIQRKEVHITR